MFLEQAYFVSVCCARTPRDESLLLSVVDIHHRFNHALINKTCAADEASTEATQPGSSR